MQKKKTKQYFLFKLVHGGKDMVSKDGSIPILSARRWVHPSSKIIRTIQLFMSRPLRFETHDTY